MRLIFLLIIFSTLLISGCTNTPNESIDLMKEGKTKIQDEIINSPINFAIYPQEWEMERNKKIMIGAGVVNKETDNKTHFFSINIEPMDPEDESWIIDQSELNHYKYVKHGHLNFFPISLIPPSDTKPGPHIFTIYACIDKEDCKSKEDSNFENPAILRIIIK